MVASRILYFMRHGIAQPYSVASRDAERTLTEQGRVQVEQQASQLKTDIHQPSIVLSSPYLRAVETGDIVARVLGIARETEPLIAPGAQIDDIQECLHRFDADETVMFVHHQPDLSYIHFGLTGRSLSFGESMITRIELDTMNPLSGTCIRVFRPAFSRP